MRKEKAENKGSEQFEIKYDCFAYDKEKNECTGLNRLYCKTEQCRFYRTDITREEIEEKIKAEISRDKHALYQMNYKKKKKAAENV